VLQFSGQHVCSLSFTKEFEEILPHLEYKLIFHNWTLTTFILKEALSLTA